MAKITKKSAPVPTTTKDAATTSPPPAEVPAEDAAPTTEDAVVKTADVVVAERFAALQSKVTEMTNILRDLTNNLRLTQKELTKLVKSNSRRTKTRNATGKKTPSGFAKPTKLSDSLCEFLGVAPGTEMARTDVTRSINTYIKEHKLQDEKDRRKIHPDAKLSKVLTIKPGDTLTFFNLQTSLKNSFIKTA